MSCVCVLVGTASRTAHRSGPWVQITKFSLLRGGAGIRCPKILSCPEARALLDVQFEGREPISSASKATSKTGIGKMTEQALSPTKLISIISSSADTIASPLEAIAAFSHACMLAAGFRFLGYGEDHKAGTGLTFLADDRTRVRRDTYPKAMDF